MAIKISTKTNKKECLKLYNNIISFLFEQEYEELKCITPKQKQAFLNVKKVLSDIIKS